MSDDQRSHETSANGGRVVFFRLDRHFNFVGSVLFFRFYGRLTRFTATCVRRFTIDGRKERSLCLRYVCFILMRHAVRRFVHGKEVRYYRHVRDLCGVETIHADRQGMNGRVCQTFRYFRPVTSDLVKRILPFTIRVRCDRRWQDGLIPIKSSPRDSSDAIAILRWDGFRSTSFVRCADSIIKTIYCIS